MCAMWRSMDEGYLKLLDEFNKANDSTYVNCGNFEQIFMPQTYRISNAQLMTMLSFDANASAKSIPPRPRSASKSSRMPCSSGTSI